jgi:hypothetical protein
MEKETTSSANFVIRNDEIKEMELFRGDLVKDMRISNELKYRKNPFIVDSDGQFILDVKTKDTKIFRGKGNEKMVNTDTGEVVAETYFVSTKKVDKEQFVKLYLTQIKNLFDLTQTAYKMIFYLTTLLKPNKDEVYLFVPDVMEFCQWSSKPRVYKAIKELIKYEIIAPSWKPNIYYINPQILFNGDKLVLIQKYQIDDNWSQINPTLPAIMPEKGENKEKLKDLFNLMDNENGEL